MTQTTVNSWTALMDALYDHGWNPQLQRHRPRHAFRGQQPRRPPAARPPDQLEPTLARFDALQEQPFLIFLEPPSLDERIVNQVALFSVLSRPGNTGQDPASREPTAKLSDVLAGMQAGQSEGMAPVYKKIIIPAALKWEIRDKLDQANVNERVLFPGLDGLCAWLRRHYAARD